FSREVVSMVSFRPWSWLHQQSSRSRRRPARRGVTRRTPMRLELLEDRCLPSVYTVTNTNDSGSGSLRQAIINANSHIGLDAIQFAIGSGSQKIMPVSALPTITDPVVIDATTQLGFSGTPIINLRGSTSGQASFNGLTITAANCVVRGLVINR